MDAIIPMARQFVNILIDIFGGFQIGSTTPTGWSEWSEIKEGFAQSGFEDACIELLHRARIVRGVGCVGAF